MSASPSSNDLRDRVRWVGQECLVIASIAAFWIVFGLVTVSLIGAVGGRTSWELGPIVWLPVEASNEVEQLWLVVGALALATTALYVVVRAGTVLLDHRAE